MKRLGNKLKLFLAALLAAALLAPSAAFAGKEKDGEFEIDCPEVRYLELDTDNLDYQVTGQQMLDGWTQTKTIVAKISANCQWVLNIYGTSEYWTKENEDGNFKSVGDIWWNYSQNPFQALTLTPNQIASGGKKYNQAYPVHIKIALDISQDGPGVYHYEFVTFEITAP
ncbi:MAG: hypothetical protein HRF49_01055 [bacterium]|jgi:hypothetical protein